MKFIDILHKYTKQQVFVVNGQQLIRSVLPIKYPL